MFLVVSALMISNFILKIVDS